jgi:hypothetical protein
MPHRLSGVHNAIADSFVRRVGNRWEYHCRCVGRSVWWSLCRISSESEMMIDHCHCRSITPITKAAHRAVVEHDMTVRG